jgi:Ca-activated chloride channel homolog
MFKTFCTSFQQFGAQIIRWIILSASLISAASAQSPLDEVHIAPRPELMAAAQPTADASSAIRPLIKKNVDLVLVPVTVSDPMQRLVTGLNAENFQIFDDKQPQAIKHFSSEDAPVSLGIIVDTSGSMANKMDRVSEALKQLCAFSNPQDEFFVITFSDQPSLLQDFTDSPGDIEEKLLYAVPKGRTALLDAIYVGLNRMHEAKYSKRALLIISDGGDNHSRYTEGEIKSMVKESDVTIYAIGIFDRYAPTQEEALGPFLLSSITDITGGRTYILDNLTEMPTVARHIGIELRTQYVLGYTPQHPPHDGKWHKICIKLRIPKNFPYLQAKAKTGYYASNE